MAENVKRKSASKRFAPAGAVFAVLGVVLFIYFVRKAGVREIWEQMRLLGAGFLLILALSGFRFAVRALAWTLCFEAPHRLRFVDAFKAYLTGDAAGNIVPLGIVVSEPAKAALVRDRVPLVAGLSAIAVENIFYSLSVALFIFGGAAALMWSFQLSEALRWSSIGILAGVAVVLAVAFAVVRLEWKLLSGALERLYERGIGRRVLETRRERVRALEDRVYGFYARNRARFLPILFLEACFHLAGVAEVYVTLYFISDAPPTLLTAFVLESVNRVINVVFK
ncbi:MAG: lysylphosphatidylglycerol synthase transmembrane domain-containing protein, partial [Pyrinomonadaceae bacterium]